MMEDTEVPFGVRAKIAQDLLDRAGLVATQVHQIVPTTEDPMMRFFEGAFSDPSNWESNPQPDPTPAIESYATSSRRRHDADPEEIVEADIAQPEGEPADDTPPRIAEMIKAARSTGRRGSDRGGASSAGRYISGPATCFAQVFPTLNGVERWAAFVAGPKRRSSVSTVCGGRHEDHPTVSVTKNAEL